MKEYLDIKYKEILMGAEEIQKIPVTQNMQLLKKGSLSSNNQAFNNNELIINKDSNRYYNFVVQNKDFDEKPQTLPEANFEQSFSRSRPSKIKWLFIGLAIIIVIIAIGIIIYYLT